MTVRSNTLFRGFHLRVKARRPTHASRAVVLTAVLVTTATVTGHPCDAAAVDNAPGVQLRADHLPENPLQAAPGITAVSGQIVDIQGKGVPNVEMSVGTSHTRSDASGRFLVTYVIPGLTVLQIDGRKGGNSQNIDYGYYEVRVEATKGSTTVLPFKSWLPQIDHRHDVMLKSPSTTATVITTPDIPDLELHIPAGTVIRDADGHVVTKIGITALPRDRTPFPIPDQFEIPTFYTIQPGASCLYDAQGGVGWATLSFPNFNHDLPKGRATLWRYEPDGNGWTSFGYGSVSQDGRQVVPERGVVLTDFDSGECDPATQLRKAPPARPVLNLKQGSK